MSKSNSKHLKVSLNEATEIDLHKLKERVGENESQAIDLGSVLGPLTWPLAFVKFVKENIF